MRQAGLNYGGGTSLVAKTETCREARKKQNSGELSIRGVLVFYDLTIR